MAGVPLASFRGTRRRILRARKYCTTANGKAETALTPLKGLPKPRRRLSLQPRRRSTAGPRRRAGGRRRSSCRGWLGPPGCGGAGSRVRNPLAGAGTFPRRKTSRPPDLQGTPHSLPLSRARLSGTPAEFDAPDARLTRTTGAGETRTIPCSPHSAPETPPACSPLKKRTDRGPFLLCPLDSVVKEHPAALPRLRRLGMGFRRLAQLQAASTWGIASHPHLGLVYIRRA